MGTFYIFLNFFLLCGSVTSFDVMRYTSVQYSILYQQFLDSSDTFYPSFGYPLNDTWSSTMIYGNKDYKLPALLANGTLGPYPKNPYDVSLVFSDYYLTQAIVRLRKL